MPVQAALTQYLTLTANTVASITLNPAQDDITVRNRDGLAEVFFTVDGSNPTVGGNGTYLLPALAGASVKVAPPLIGGQVNQIKLISSGTPQVMVDPTSISQVSGSAPAYITPLVTSLNAVTATATGAALDSVYGRETITMAVNQTFGVAPTAISTQLQGSLDNTVWFNIGAPLTDTSNGTFAVHSAGVVARYFRAVTTITGGTTNSVTAKLLAVP